MDAAMGTERGTKGPTTGSSEVGAPLRSEHTRIKDIEEGAAPAGKKSELRENQKSMKKNQDENIMGTNNSSIVSKRSVERYYYPQPHFLKYFVKKPQRRSPLIHKGYWLRMYIIEQAVLKFLREPSEKRKIILNLGCGDPLPFQCLSQYPEECEKATFIDVDYPELMSRKRDIIQKHDELRNLVWPTQDSAQVPANTVRSKGYMAVGCDLRDTEQLSRIVDRELGLGSGGCLVLCVAEVSITYMDVLAADALIKWATHYEDVRFCLLEQFLPDSEEHPFAQRMLHHFENFSTPLKSVHAYPLLKDQETRFLQAGYHRAQARSLWDLWQDPLAVATGTRQHLNTVEPFDEWEEFALFCSHYFFLEAVKVSGSTMPFNMTDPCPNQDLATTLSNIDISDSTTDTEGSTLELSAVSDTGWQRRFAAIIPSSQDTVSLHGGFSTHCRSAGCDHYWLCGRGLEVERERTPDPPPNIPARMCHTITGLAANRYLLVGGRTSPDHALSGCWLLSSGQWRAVDDLPIPLYRHCATVVAFGRSDSGVLVFGGRTTGGVVVNRWFLWQETSGWIEIHSLSENLRPRFGAATAATGDYCGILLGGMTDEGNLCNEIWKWTITYGCEQYPYPRLDISLQRNTKIAPRMGACLVWSPMGLLLIGGISEYLIPWEQEVLCLLEKADELGQSSYALHASLVDTEYPQPDLRPLLIGHAAHVLDDILLIAGGGAVCFSFGSYVNHSIYTGRFANGRGINYHYRFWKPDTNVARNPRPELKSQAVDVGVPSSSANRAEVILRVKVETAEDFNRLVDKGRPFVIEGLDLGLCREWTATGLTKKINPDTTITVHQAQEGNMNFQHKNFRYVKKPFGDFMKEICSDGSRQYLRSLAANKPADEPARFYEDFPNLRDDFQIPPQLEMVARNEHSSPLRISGPVNMWLHYDVMANVLCQISGKKVVALYPPSDAIHFKIPPGSSSSPIDVFADDSLRRGLVDYARPYVRAALSDGDVLYIPPLWLHSASPLENLSVSVNVFFRNLNIGYAAGRDVYGNRDLQAYENGRKNIDKMIKSFDNLPADVGAIYLERLAHWSRLAWVTTAGLVSPGLASPTAIVRTCSKLPRGAPNPLHKKVAANPSPVSSQDKVMAAVAIPPRQTPTPPPSAPSLSLDTSSFEHGVIPNKHLPYCSPGPAPYRHTAPATPPASPPTPQSEIRTLSVLHPPDAQQQLLKSPPVFLIQPSTLATAVHQSASQELPDPKYVFPWLHGLHPENQIQLAFFTARKKTLRNTPQCFRGLTIIKAGGDLTKCKIKGALAPNEILTPEHSGDDTFLEVDPREGFSVRNFQIQATKVAMVSDIVVYRDGSVMERDLHKLAKRLSRAQDTWRVKSTNGDQELPIFGVFILSCPFEEFEQHHSELVAIGSDGCQRGEQLDFFQLERQEMCNMSRASEIAKNVWLGPAPDSTVASGGHGNPDFDIFIEASDLAQTPDPQALKRLGDSSVDAPQHLEFPSSGSIMPQKWPKAGPLDPITQMCQWIHGLADPDAAGDVSEDTPDQDGDIPMKTLHPRPRKFLIYCADGYTESTLLGLAYFMYAERIPVHEAWLRLHCQFKRNFFAYPSDVALLSSLQARILELSPGPGNGISGSLQDDPAWLSRFDGSLPSRILPYMYLGNLGHANNPQLLRALGIKRVLSVGEPVGWTKGQRESWGSKNLLFIDRVQDNGVDCLTKDFERCLEFIAHIQSSCFVRARRLNVIIQPHLRFAYELVKWDEVLQKRRGQPIRRELEWATIAREIAAMNKPYSR
ncbi:MAG: hypothetical protein Q9218_001601 [Villophora microphyllina]